MRFKLGKAERSKAVTYLKSLFPLLGCMAGVVLLKSWLTTSPESLPPLIPSLPALIQTNPSPTPTRTPNLPPIPEVTARSFVINQIAPTRTLAQYRSHLPLRPASTTKMMTALVTLEHRNPQELIQIATFSAEGSQVGFKPMQKVTVQDLLYGLLLPSGNDAAVILANSYQGGSSNFINQMNFKASQLGLHNTYYQNSSGLDDDGHLSSARDLAILGETALQNPLISQIVSTKEIQITPQNASPSAGYKVKNINQLLFDEPGVTGLKTGFTYEAGEVLVTSYQQDSDQLIIVVMGSQDRFEDTRKLLHWAKEVLNTLPKSGNPSS